MNRLEYYDEESTFLEEMNTITENRITKLSLQLQTYLNYKKATIQAFCSDYEISSNDKLSNRIHDWEEELKSRIWDYINYLKMNFKLNEIMKFKLLCLEEEAK